MYTFKRKEKIPATLVYSNPYWLNDKHDVGIYTVNDHSLIGKPENDAAQKIIFDINILDLNLKISRDLVYKYTDPVKGEIYRPFEVLPPVTVNISEKVFVFSDSNPKTVLLTVKANQNNFEGTLHLKTSNGSSVFIKKSSNKTQK